MREPDQWLEMARLRHSGPAQLVRRLAYGAVVGGTAWPLKFKASTETPDEEPAQDLYFHLPFCRTLCPHCPYLKRRYQQNQAAEYCIAIQREVEHWLAASPGLPLRSIYFGGGTPVLLFEGIAAILNALSARIVPDTGIGLELHPADVTPDLVRRLRRLRFDRVSLGVESLQPETLRRLGRGVTPPEVLRAVDLLTEGGFACVDANLIYGVEGQEAAGVLRDAQTLLDLGVDQISAYPLFSFRHTKAGILPSWRHFRERDRLGRALREMCLSRGLQPSSVWSFNRPTRPAYTTVTLETFRGFGAGAATRGIQSFRFHTFDIDEYMKPGGERMGIRLSADERFFKSHWLYWKIYQLHVPVARYSELFGAALNSDFRFLRDMLKRMGWMEEKAGEWQINPRGADWVHRLQQLYSLSWIDLFWERCQAESWPDEVLLL
jgi:oxygen-independent coproporphyrinogen-3 oxidase